MDRAYVGNIDYHNKCYSHDYFSTKDCEFTDGPTPSPTQVLERHVARLEARIRELEHTDPHVRPGPSRQASQPRRSIYHEWGLDIEPSSPTLSEGRGPSRTGVPGSPATSTEPVVSPDPTVEPHVATIRLL